MRKFTLFILLIPFIALGQSIQKAPQLSLPQQGPEAYKAVPYTKKAVSEVSGKETFLQTPSGYVPQITAGTRDITATEIGSTTYDLQSNGSIYPRLSNNVDGSYSAVWTFAQTPGPSWTDRGSGYNYYDGSVWATQPATRIEVERTGFTNVGYTANKNEIVLSHACSIGAGQIYIASRSTKGTGTWTETSTALTSPSAGSLWPRMAIGGSDGNTVHVIALTTPTGNGGTVYNGQDGALLYSRSLDGGATWDKIQVDLPGLDASQYLAFGGDAYAIDASGTTVAIAIGGFTNDWIIMRSDDNGDTWTKTIVWQFPIPLYASGQSTDIDGDAVADTLDTQDGNVAVLIDNSGFIHTWAGYNRVFNDGSAAGFYYFPGWNGLLYWNSEQGSYPPSVITGSEDFDGSGYLEIGDIATSYGCGLSSFPSAGIDEAGNIYLSYWAVTEGLVDIDGKNLGHSYLIYSQDLGTTWSSFDGEEGAIDYYNDAISEVAYSSIERNVANNVIHVVSQIDFCAGQGVTTDASGNTIDPCNEGQFNIIYAINIDNFLVGVPSVNNNANDIEVFPVPSSGSFTLSGVKGSNMNITVTNSLGQLVTSFANEPVQNGRISLDLTSLGDGFYNVNLESNGEVVSKKIAILKD